MIKNTQGISSSALPEQSSRTEATPQSDSSFPMSAQDMFVPAAPSSSEPVPPKALATTPPEPEATRRKRLEVSGSLRLFAELPSVIASLSQQRPRQLRKVLSGIEKLATGFAARDAKGDLDALHTAASARQQEIYDAVQQIRHESIRASLNWDISTILGGEAARAQRTPAPVPPQQRSSGSGYTIAYDVDNKRCIALDPQGQPVTDPAIIARLETEFERMRASGANITHVDASQGPSGNVNVDKGIALLQQEAARPSAPAPSNRIAQRDPYTHPATYFMALALLDHPDVGPLAREWLAHNDALFERALGIGQKDKPKVLSRWCVGPRVTPESLLKQNAGVGTRDVAVNQEILALYGFEHAPTRATKTAIYHFETAMFAFSAHGVVTSTFAALSQDFLHATLNLMPPRRKTVCVDPEGKVLPAVLLREALATLQKAQQHLVTLTDAEQTVITELKKLAQMAETMDRNSKADAAVWSQVTYLVQHMPALAQLVQDIDKQVAKVEAMLADRVRLTNKEKNQRPKPSANVQRLQADIGALLHQANVQQAPAATAAPTPPLPAVSPPAAKTSPTDDVFAAFAAQTAGIAEDARCVQMALGKTLKLWTRLPNATALKALISTCCDAATFSRFDDAADWQGKARCLAYHMNKHAAPQTPVEDYLKNAFALYRTRYNNELAPRIDGAGTYVRVVRTPTHVGIYGWDGAFINYYARD